MKTYSLTSAQYKAIANLAVQENGEGAVGYEVSLMANLFELQSKYSDIYSYIRNGGWFSRAAYWMDNGSSSSKAVSVTKSVLTDTSVRSKYFPAYINEHDCFSDIKSISTGSIRDRSAYVKDKTIIRNRYGSTYTFYCFPTSTSDPFGYTSNAYKKITGKSPSDNSTPATPSTDTTKTSADAVIQTALAEVGYLEKASNKNLDSKTANAGSGNYTKYWRDLYPSYQGLAWCDCFVKWCFFKTYGKTVANNLLCGGLHSFYTPDSAQLYKNKKQWYASPKIGDQIFFRNSERICHTGIVTGVTTQKVFTIEGNTSSASGVVPNGGCVRQKSYALSYNRIAGYGRPNYSSVSTNESSSEVVTSGDKNVIIGQKASIKFTGTSIAKDGIVGSETKRQAVRVLQTALNKDYGARLTVDGIIGSKTEAALGKHYVEYGEAQYLVTAVEILYYLHGKNPNGVEYPGHFGNGLKKCAGKSKLTASDILKLTEF